MNEAPKSIWKKSWTGPRAFLLWLLVVSVAAFLVALIIAVFTSVETTLFERHRGLESFVGYCLIVMFWFNAAVALAFVFCGAVRWLCCWRNFRRLIFALACFATLIALFYAEENWRGRHAWENFKHTWEAKGEKFELASFVPPPVPDEQNFALTPVVASCYETYFDKNGQELKPRNTNVVDRFSILSWRDISYQNRRENVPDSAGWQAAQKMDLKAWQAFFRSPPPTNFVATNSFPTTSQPQMPADDVLLALSKYDSVLEEIRQASRLPHSRFPLTYESEDAFSILLPHLAALKTSEQAIRLRSMAELQKNRAELAVEDVKLALYLANAIRTETFPISQLVRVSMLEIALQPVWEGLAEHRWSEPQLIALEEELAKLDFLADCQKALKSEIFFSAEEANYLRHHRDYDNQFSQMGVNYRDDASLKFAAYRLMPGGWFDQSALKNARTLMAYLPAVNQDTKTISPALIRQADAAATNVASIFYPLDSLKKMFNAEFLWPGNFLKKIAAGQSYVNLARTAVALERYRLAHGEFPETLDALAPQFIAKVPHDVIGGGPLKYRREINGQFVLYSIGWNETDDGGVVVNRKSADRRDENPVAPDISQGDWVWRYPKAE